jgi:uncharacterized protein
MSERKVLHNADGKRFEVQQEGQIAVLDYERDGQTLRLIDTFVPPALEGQGIGGALAKAGLDYARSEGLAVEPVCEFVQAYLKRHPEYADLLKANS